jgi:MFS family permease
MLTYPLPDDRGLYLGIWSAMRNLGSVVGGAINYAINFSYGGSGGVAWSTYIVFIALCCTTPIFAILLSPTRKVRRRDGTRVNIGAKMNFKHEMIGLWRHIRHPRVSVDGRQHMISISEAR